MNTHNTGLSFVHCADVVAGRSTPRRGTSDDDSAASDFDIRPSKRRRIVKGSHKSRVPEFVLPAERTSSRVGAKVVNYNEAEDDSVHEEDLMPNEHGEVWTYGNLFLDQINWS